MKIHKLLTQKKHLEAKKKKPHIIYGKPLRVNVSTRKKYADSLGGLVDKMTEDVKNKILALFNSNTATEFFAMDESIASQARIVTNQLTKKWDSIFSFEAHPKAKKMVAQQSASSAVSLTSSLKELSGGLTIPTDILTGPLKDITTAAVAQNVSLIKSIPQQYLHQVKGAVMRSITTGNGLQDLVPALEKYEGMTKRRATNIALDQTRKVFNNINTARSLKVGLKQGEWLHSGGSIHPRETHMDSLDGKIYNLSEGLYDPAVGYNIQPGQLVFCHCTYRPVLEFNEG